MKTPFWTQAITLRGLAVATLCGLSPSAHASPLLAFLDPLVDEAARTDAPLAVAAGVEREQEAAAAQVSAERRPSVAFSAQTGPTKTWQWNQDGAVEPGASTTWGARAGVNAQQNLWKGGVTSLKEEAATLRSASATLDTTKRRESLRTGLASDLLDLATLSRGLAQRAVLLEQAKALERVAARKSASGFLGKKELQETQRETLRAQLDLEDGRLEFDLRIAKFNRTYGLQTNALTKERLESFVARLETAARAGESKIGRPDLLQEAAAKSFDLRQSATSVQASEKESAAASRQVYAPSLDLGAGLEASRIDNANVPAPLRDAAADAQLSASASLTFRLSLLAPEARAAATAASARLDTTLRRRAQTERALKERVDALEEEKRLLQRRLEDSRKLLALSEDLRDKNVRLFEAGEFDVVTVVASQQDVARQKQSELAVRARLDALGLEALALAETGVPAVPLSGGVSGGGQGSFAP